MRQTSFAPMHCSMARSLEVMGDWWTPLILRDLYLGLAHFDELAEDLDISRNLLSSRLQALVDNGIVERQRYQAHPPRDAYILTEAGRDLIPVLMALTAWGNKWVPPRGGPPLLFHHQPCDHEFSPQVSCSHCGGRITTETVDPLPGPGGRIAPGTRLIAQRLVERHRSPA